MRPSNVRRFFDFLNERSIQPHLVLEQAVEEKSSNELSVVEAHRHGDGNVGFRMSDHRDVLNRRRVPIPFRIPCPLSMSSATARPVNCVRGGLMVSGNILVMSL